MALKSLQDTCKALKTLQITAGAVPKRSEQFKRRFRLLQSILPQMPEAAAHASKAAGRYEREFWTDFLTPCVTMELAKWPFDLLHDEHDGLVTNVLTDLNQIIQSNIPESCKGPRFSGLEALAQAIETAAEVQITLTKPKPSDDEKIIELLKRLAIIMSNNKEKSQPPPESTPVSSKTKSLLAPLIVNLFSTLSTFWRCKCDERSHREAALALFTNRIYLTDNASFTVLLSKPKTTKSNMRWLETGITVHKTFSKSKVQFITTDSKPEKKYPVVNLCKMTQGLEESRVKLNVHEKSLFCHGRTDNEMARFQASETVSFSKGFLTNGVELGFDGKISLAVVLSFSFLDFCGKPWFPGHWGKESIYLMQNEDHISVQPFLIANIGLSLEEIELSTETTIINLEARLLDHGILLMEIFKQGSFEDFLEQHETSLLDHLEKQKKARLWLDSISWDVFEQWHRAVETCINGALISNLEVSMKMATQMDNNSAKRQKLTVEESRNEIFARLFHEVVLAPLEADFASQWPNQDPDQAISTLNLPNCPQRSLRIARHEPVTSRVITASHQQPQPQSPLSASHFPVAGDNEGKFFDATDSPNMAEIQSAEEWFNYFEKIQNKLPRRARSPDKRIKIGVLDTGIDLENTFISQKRHRISCWPPGADHHDNEGHGTHVAYLLLRLTKHADLRICKITNSASINDANIDRIAEAITHFSQNGDDRVDILTLSFGFPRYDDVLKPIFDAIRKARDCGVIIFAAAGNEGGNAGVFWPASLHGADFVIRINSSDGKGSPSNFNPNSGTGNWICTLGQGVPSCHTKIGPDGESQVVHRSGSSFATPIAAAIAAIILGIVDNADVSKYHKEFEALRPRLRMRSAMEEVLCQTCVLSQKINIRSHSYVTPWFFFESEEWIQIPKIANILMNLRLWA